ncbi:hypothetical protein FHW69_002968 [Luteibacter sp. Sphag1AF]|uniref:restriction endonuclease n=1 Tax=Luteibacter sp. Sphag1AF TaxID=2587031 RepID=UPI001610F124|nr:restriction endonuclease [Luteibacter sp. Sphag1AF]MBB3228333.1 hypothetical protein [Luteibacter sp. Sphag1AF]
MAGPNNESRRGTDALSRLSWHDFEHLLAEHFRDQGYRVEHFAAAGSLKALEGGVDLRLRRGSEFVIAQCKHWNAAEIAASDVQALLGTMLDEAANSAILITRGQFSADARRAALRQPRLRLVDADVLRVMLKLGDPMEPAALPATTRTRDRPRPSRRGSDASVSRFLPIALVAVIVLMLSVLVWRNMHPAHPPVAPLPPPPAPDVPLSAIVGPAPPTTTAPPVIPYVPPVPTDHVHAAPAARQSDDAMKVMERNTREVGQP